MYKYNSLEISVVMGFKTGFDSKKVFCYCLQKLLEEEFATGKYKYFVSFNVVPSTTVYRKEWGCPPGGESTYTLSAVANPLFVDNLKDWEEDCKNYILAIKKWQEQNTVSIVKKEIVLTYDNIKE